MYRFATFLAVVFFNLLIFSCKPDDTVDPKDENGVSQGFGDSKMLVDFNGEQINEWNNLHIKLIQSTPGYSVPVAARSLAYTNLALYESTYYGIENYQSLSTQISGLEELPKPEAGKTYNWALAGNAAQYTILRELYSTSSDVLKSRIDTLRRQNEVSLKAGIDEDIVERSIRLGAAVATAIWEYSKNDGAHEAYVNNFPNSYVRKGGAASWRPTSSQQVPLLSNWSDVKSLISDVASEKVTMPVSFSFNANSDYFKEANEVYTTVRSLNDVQNEIMEHWYDGEQSFTAVGHHLAVINALAFRENFNLEKMVKLNLQTALAFHEASISSMKTKYNTDIMRPITYIRQTIDPFWSPIKNGENAPEFTSLTATIAGAAAEVLRNTFGEEYTFEDATYASALGKRPYTNFTTYAKEASLAHFYAGAQLRMSTEAGLEEGKKVAQNILALPLELPTEEVSENM